MKIIILKNENCHNIKKLEKNKTQLKKKREKNTNESRCKNDKSVFFKRQEIILKKKKETT